MSIFSPSNSSISKKSKERLLSTGSAARKSTFIAAPDTLASTSDIECSDASQSKFRRKIRRASAKKGISTKDSASEKVDTAANELRQNQAFFDHFLERMDVWLRKNSHKVLTVMKKFDQELEGLVTYDEFKSAMFDIDAPCNAVELHLLCKILDLYDEKDIDYTMLHIGLGYIRNTEDTASADNKSISSTLSANPVEPEVTHLVQWLGSKKAYSTDNPRYALVHFIHITFAKDKNHSSHVSDVVAVNISGLSMAEIIRHKTKNSVSARQFKLFIGRQCSVQQLFAPDSTLWEHGCQGGIRSHPERVVLFYNYATVFNDCPILMCDYYINLITTRNRDALETRRMLPNTRMQHKASLQPTKTALEKRDSTDLKLNLGQ